MKACLRCSMLLGSVLALGGCASLSENECRSADWESIGYRDGSQGHNAGRLAAHSEACAEYGIKADREQYEQGRLQGLELFCTSSNALRLGRQGYAYSGVCPLSLEPAFSRGYELGRQLHGFDARLQQLRTEIQRVQTELRREETAAHRQGTRRAGVRARHQPPQHPRGRHGHPVSVVCAEP